MCNVSVSVMHKCGNGDTVYSVFLTVYFNKRSIVYKPATPQFKKNKEDIPLYLSLILLGAYVAHFLFF